MTDSAPEATNEVTQGASAPERESSAGVVGVAFGLVLIAIFVLVVAVQGSKTLDPQALVDASFDVGELPFGLAPVEGAEVATGETLVMFSIPEIEEAPKPDVPEPKLADGEEEESYDWSTLVEGEEGTAPVQVFLVWYPNKTSGAAVDRLFDNVAWRDLRDFRAGGGRLMTEKDSLAWAGYDADYVIERELERGGTFRDWMRVNLSLPDRACVLFARWARGMPAAKERVQEILRVLRPQALPNEGADAD